MCIMYFKSKTYSFDPSLSEILFMHPLIYVDDVAI